MTISEKKEYLSNYRTNLAKIKRLTELIADYPEDAERLKSQLAKAKKMRDKIENEISLLRNPVFSEILAQKYQCGKTIEEIAFCMNYSSRHIERLHTNALKIFEPLDFTN